MIQASDLLSLSYYELAVFTGSFGSLRYRIEKQDIDDKNSLLVTAWNTPLAFDHTPDEDKETYSTQFSVEGLSDIADWLNQRVSQ